MSAEDRQAAALERIADALERISPVPQSIPAFSSSDGYVWRTEPNRLDATKISRVPLKLLLGVDRAKATIMDNTRRFAQGLPANNALLWGARGKREALWDLLDVWRTKALDVDGRGIAEAGHFIPEEAPQILADEIQEFFAQPRTMLV